MIFMIGFHPMEVVAPGSLFATAPEGTQKIVYWMGSDAETLYTGPYHDIKKLIPQIRSSVTKSFCDSKRTEDILTDLELNPEALVFPREEGGIRTHGA